MYTHNIGAFFWKLKYFLLSIIGKLVLGSNHNYLMGYLSVSTYENSFFRIEGEIDSSI